MWLIASWSCCHDRLHPLQLRAKRNPLLLKLLPVIYVFTETRQVANTEKWVFWLQSVQVSANVCTFSWLAPCTPLWTYTCWGGYGRLAGVEQLIRPAWPVCSKMTQLPNSWWHQCHGWQWIVFWCLNWVSMRQAEGSTCFEEEPKAFRICGLPWTLWRMWTERNLRVSQSRMACGQHMPHGQELRPGCWCLGLTKE